MHRDRMRNMDEMSRGMFLGDPMMALTNGRDGGHRHRHGDDRHGRDMQPWHSRGSDVAPHGGHYDPFSFMSSMMSNMHNMMGNAFQHMVCVST